MPVRNDRRDTPFFLFDISACSKFFFIYTPRAIEITLSIFQFGQAGYSLVRVAFERYRNVPVLVPEFYHEVDFKMSDAQFVVTSSCKCLFMNPAEHP